MRLFEERALSTIKVFLMNTENLKRCILQSNLYLTGIKMKNKYI